MRRERLMELIDESGLKRTHVCCPGVPNKLCMCDEWKGDMSALAFLIEKEVKQELQSK